MWPFSWTVGSFCNRGRQKTVKPMIPSLIDTGNCFEQFLLCSKFVKDFFLVYKHEIATFDTNSLHNLKNWPFSALLHKVSVCFTEYTIVDPKSFSTVTPFFWSWHILINKCSSFTKYGHSFFGSILHSIFQKSILFTFSCLVLNYSLINKKYSTMYKQTVIFMGVLPTPHKNIGGAIYWQLNVPYTKL